MRLNKLPTLWSDVSNCSDDIGGTRYTTRQDASAGPKIRFKASREVMFNFHESCHA